VTIRLVVSAIRGTVESVSVCVALAVKRACAGGASCDTVAVVSRGAGVSERAAVVRVDFEVDTAVSSLCGVGEESVTEVVSAFVAADSAVAFGVTILNGVASRIGACAGVSDASTSSRVVTSVALDSALSTVAETFTVCDVGRAVRVTTTRLDSVLGNTSVSTGDSVA